MDIKSMFFVVVAVKGSDIDDVTTMIFPGSSETPSIDAIYDKWLGKNGFDYIEDEDKDVDKFSDEYNLCVRIHWLSEVDNQIRNEMVDQIFGMCQSSDVDRFRSAVEALRRTIHPTWSDKLIRRPKVAIAYDEISRLDDEVIMSHYEHFIMKKYAQR